MKTYLILINNAPKMGAYHKALGDELIKRGNKVIYALSDHNPIDTKEINLTGENYYIFSDYFKVNYNKPSINEKYKAINIWKTYFSDFDRNIVHYNLEKYDKEYYHSLMSNLINFYDKIINEQKIDCIIYENISNSFAYTAYEVGRLNGIPYRGYVGSRLPNRFELHTEEFGILERFEKVFNSLDMKTIDPDSLEEIRTYLSKYDGTSMPTYHAKKSKLSADYSLIKRYFNKEKFGQLYSSFIRSFSDAKNHKFNYQIQNPFSTYITLFKRQIVKKITSKTLMSMFQQPEEEDKYYLFPLHMKPESSTSVLARHYCDDLAVIRNIAFNLPFGRYLYVKEHFVNIGNQPKSFYQALSDIPNVKLIRSDADSTMLIRNCEALITLTSTMGLEALLMGKKVIAFGDVFYCVHPNCIKLNGFTSLFEVLSNLSSHPNALDGKDRLYMINERFVATYRAITYEGFVGYPIYEKEDFDKFVQPIVGALEKFDEVKNELV